MQTSCALDVCDQHVEGLTLEETGNLLNLTRERIRQIEGVALEKIREGLGLTEEQIELLLKSANKSHRSKDVIKCESGQAQLELQASEQ